MKRLPAAVIHRIAYLEALPAAVIHRIAYLEALPAAVIHRIADLEALVRKLGSDPSEPKPEPKPDDHFSDPPWKK